MTVFYYEKLSETFTRRLRNILLNNFLMKILSTRGVAHEIENIIQKAQSEITLVSPYLKFEEKLFTRLILKAEEGINTTIVYGKKELSSVRFEQLESIPNVTLYFNKDLHAKVYFNETHAILTSMNLYDYSELHNFEIGGLIKIKDDKKAYQKLIDETKLIIASSELKLDNSFGIDDRIAAHVKSKRPLNIENFPKPHISISIPYTINPVQYNLDREKLNNDELKNQFFKTIKRKMLEGTEKNIGYRVYWNYYKISLYDDKYYKESDHTKEENAEYFLKGITKLNSLIQEYFP